MRPLYFVFAFLGLGVAAPQRGVGGCPRCELVCGENQSVDTYCDCRRDEARGCSKLREEWATGKIRSDCPAPPPEKPLPEICIQNGQQYRDPGRPPQYGNDPYNPQYGNGPFNPIYTTGKITYVITTTLPGFYSPRPVTSYSTVVSLVTITISGPPPNSNSGWNQPQTTWPTVTVYGSGIPPWTSKSTTPTRPPQPVTTYSPKPTTRPTPTTISTPKTTAPWSVPPPPPLSYIPSVISSSTSWRPPVWTPPPNTGPSWTPIQGGTNPVASSTSVPRPVSPSPVNTGPAIPTDLGQPAPVAGALQKCGPGAARCPDGTYCDPQPLCSIGEDCAGVCLPTFSTKSTDFQQPWEVRRIIWQDLLNSGNYSIHQFNGDS